jgi:hypothetical protein
MDALARFISDQNIARYADLLHHESDPKRRATLELLLLEEEDRFARDAERLDLAERLLANGEERIARQRTLISGLRDNGHNVGRAEIFLTNMLVTQQLFRNFHASALNAINGLNCAKPK